MGTADGYVVGLVKVHDEGSPSDRFNLILVADGYQVGELGQFESDVDDFVTHLFATPPFDEEEVACGLNIYRLDVVSDESGADDPKCDGGGDPITADTYFDATFCGDGEVQRYVSGDSELVQSTVENYLPEWTGILVLVNDLQHGGASSGSMAWATTGGFAWKTPSFTSSDITRSGSPTSTTTSSVQESKNRSRTTIAGPSRSR